MLCWIFPYTGDDWAWGSSIGIERWNTRFQNYSGRYVGNIIVLLLTRSRILRALIMASCITGISYMIIKISNCKNHMMILIIALIFSAPKALLRQSIVWTSGFSNYATSITLFILYVFLITYLFPNTKHLKGKTTIQSFFLLILGYLSAMIVEHITIMQIILSGCIAFWVWKKYYKPIFTYIAYFIGSVCGAITMFSNECYSSAVSGTDGYRSVATNIYDLCQKIHSNYFDIIGKQMILDNLILELFVSIIITLLFIKMSNNNSRILKITVILINFSVFYGLITRINSSWSGVYKLGKYTDGCINIIFWISLLIFTVFIIENQYKKIKMIGVLLCIAFSSGSLLLVSPIGPRCFFACYILLIWYCMECISLITINHELTKIFLVSSTLLMSLILYMNFTIYGSIYKQDKLQLKTIRQAMVDGKTDITIPILPFEDYLHCARLNGIWEERYKLFYEIPLELKINYK